MGQNPLTVNLVISTVTLEAPNPLVKIIISIKVFCKSKIKNKNSIKIERETGEFGENE